MSGRLSIFASREGELVPLNDGRLAVLWRFEPRQIPLRYEAEVRSWLRNPQLGLRVATDEEARQRRNLAPEDPEAIEIEASRIARQATLDATYGTHNRRRELRLVAAPGRSRRLLRLVFARARVGFLRRDVDLAGPELAAALAPHLEAAEALYVAAKRCSRGAAEAKFRQLPKGRFRRPSMLRRIRQLTAAIEYRFEKLPQGGERTTVWNRAHDDHAFDRFVAAALGLDGSAVRWRDAQGLARLVVAAEGDPRLRGDLPGLERAARALGMRGRRSTSRSSTRTASNAKGSIAA
jgi:hypothetical protein